MIILNRAEVEDLIELPAAVTAIRAAYVSASRGDVTLPPVGHITFPALAADCHIKYGHIGGHSDFVIKIATGFPQNATMGMPTGNGLSLVMSAETGGVKAILHDEMVMTDIRTGIGGAIATQALARAGSRKVLVMGTGPQAQRQIESHVALIKQKMSFEIWGRSVDKAAALARRVSFLCDARAVNDVEQAACAADIIITATGASTPLIERGWVSAGTHITAVGADAPGKQELATDLVTAADVLVADNTDQCLDHGELSTADKSAALDHKKLRELGRVLAGVEQGRRNDAEITIADLTGIAAQDIAIAGVVLNTLAARSDGSA